MLGQKAKQPVGIAFTIGYAMASPMDLAISTTDTAILVAYIAGVVVFGIWIGRGQHDTTDYLLGGRDLPWWAVLISIVATETSTVTFLSVPGLAFAAKGGNMTFLQLALGYILGRLAVVFFFLPLFFEGKLFTAYEVLHRRLGQGTQKTASLMFLITRTAADGLRLYLTALVLEQVLGWNITWCVAVMGTATIVYTVLGGLKSVVWNDVIQFIIYVLGGGLALAVIADKLPGGWDQMIAYGNQHGKFQIFDFRWDAHLNYTFWAGLIGGFFVSLATHGTDQLMVQRYLSAKSQRQAGWALFSSGLAVFAQFALFLLVGVGLAAFYAAFPGGESFRKTDQVFAAFIVDYMPVGITGITLAAVFSAAMSTLSGSLNSSATAAVNDFYVPACREKPSESHLLRISRVLTVLFGMLQICVGILGQMTQNTPVVDSVLTIASITTGVILGLFFLAVLVKDASQHAALTGLLAGLSIVCCVAFNPYFLPGAYQCVVGWPWYAVIGSLSVLTIAWIIHFATKPRKESPHI
ncbi:MAG: sodium:solute symporter [Pirellulales bacterium]|nr:sodium:solute symporter [Pirellulales bacterium]